MRTLLIAILLCAFCSTAYGGCPSCAPAAPVVKCHNGVCTLLVPVVAEVREVAAKTACAVGKAVKHCRQRIAERIKERPRLIQHRRG